MLARWTAPIASILIAIPVSTPAAAQTTLICQGVGTGGPIPSAGTGGGGSSPTVLPPFPMVSTIVVSSLPADALSVTAVKLNGLTHTYAGELFFVLEDPLGQRFNLWSEPSGGCDFSGDYVVVPLDSGAEFSTCTSLLPGSYGQSFSAWSDGDLGINNTDLADVASMIGAWTLYIYDWASGDVGTLASWEICFGIAAVPLPVPPFIHCVGLGAGGAVPTSGSGDGIWPSVLPSAPFASSLALTIPAGATRIVAVKLNGLTHTYLGDLHAVLEVPTGSQYTVFHRPGATVGSSSCQLDGDYEIYDSYGRDLAAGCAPGAYYQYFGGWPSGTNGIVNTPLEQIPLGSGVYTLRLYDWASADIGSLESWELCFDASPAPCVPLASLGPILAPAYQVHLVPEAWTADDVEWGTDEMPHNKIDDSIDASTDPLFDVLINYDRPLRTKDADRIESLSATSSIEFICKRVPTIAVTGMSKTEIALLASLDDVAFVERQIAIESYLGTSIASMKVPEFESLSPGVDGTGVNIAILDGGVDDGVHVALPPADFFFDAGTALFINPDDDDPDGHGTHVASTALGRNWGGLRGVARGARVIDVKVLGSTVSKKDLYRAFEVLYDNRIAWNVGVANMSWGQSCGPFGCRHDGKNALAQLVNAGDAMNILMVAAAGNDGPSNSGLSTPASASRAITVANANDLTTPNRADDVVHSTSNRGPRKSDKDDDCLDELKPEVTCYGENIEAAAKDSATGTNTLSGTSMAAPHIAGLAALIRQKYLGINAASVKALIYSSAEPRGGQSSTCDSVWNDAWGFGLVDAEKAVCTLATTDLTFPNFPGDPSWLSPDITTFPDPPEKKEDTQIKVMIRNTSATVTAERVRVEFGVHDLSTSTPAFDQIATVIVNIPPGDHQVSCHWKPKKKGHFCLQVDIGYGCDSNFSNNSVRRNLGVARSPIQFDVANTYSAAPQQIDLNVTCTGTIAGWDVFLSRSSVTLSGDDVPAKITALARPPLSAPDGSTVIVHVAATIGSQLVGGVSFKATKHDCNGNSVDDYFDIESGTSLDVNRDGIPDECSTGPSTYCTAGTSTNGCSALMSASSGTASISAGAGSFVLTASGVEGQKLGLVFYGINGPAAVTWGTSSSFLCVKAPTQRLPSANTNGTAGLCDGSLSVDFFGYMNTHPFTLGQPITAGQVYNAQAWYRDPPSPKTTNLSNGIEFTLAP